MGVAGIAAIAGGVASVGGALLSSNAASSAADTQAAAANNAANLTHQQYLQTAANLAPFLNTGQAAFNRLGTIFGLNGGPPMAAPTTGTSPGATAPSGGASSTPDAGTSLFNALGSANAALNGDTFTPAAASGGTPASGTPSWAVGTLYDPANANTAGSDLNNILQSQLTNGIPLNGIINDGNGGVYTYQNGQFVPLGGGATGAGSTGPGQSQDATTGGPTIDPNAASDALAPYGLHGLTYNPADYGLGNGIFNPAQYGLGNGTYNPAAYGLGNGVFDPSQYGLGNGTFQPTQAQLESMPGYQFTRDQGLKAVQNSATARGQGVSGAALKAGAQYATGLADTTVNTENNIFNSNLQNAKSIFGGNLANTQNIFSNNLANTKGIFTGNLANTQSIFQQNLGDVINPLLSYAQLGENAGAQTGSIGAQAVNAQSNLLVGGANAQAAGQIGSANALASGLSSVSQAPLNYMLYSNLLGGGGGGSPYAGASPAANPLLYMNSNPGFGDTSFANAGLGAVY